MKRLITIAVVMLLTLSAAQAQDIEEFVTRQMQTYPKSRLLDIYKSCFQDYLGAEHLESDRQRVKAYLDKELTSTPLDDLVPWYYEPCGIDSNYYRISIRAVKEGLITEDMLLDAFVRSANSASRPSVDSWREQWHKIIGTIDSIFVRHDSANHASMLALAAPSVDLMHLSLPHYSEDRQFIDSILCVGRSAEGRLQSKKYAISHSSDYREAYKPHYRIVRRDIFEQEIKPLIDRTTMIVRIAEIEVHPEYLEAYQHHLTTPHFQAYKQGTLHMVKSLNLLDIKPLDPDAMRLIFSKMGE